MQIKVIDGTPYVSIDDINQMLDESHKNIEEAAEAIAGDEAEPANEEERLTAMRFVGQMQAIRVFKTAINIFVKRELIELVGEVEGK